MTTTFSPLHATTQRTARVARSYWRCCDCGANHALDVDQCIYCSGPDQHKAAPRRSLRPRHWFALMATWAAATAMWAVAAGLFARGG